MMLFSTLLLLTQLANFIDTSYNRPKLSPCAQWSSEPIMIDGILTKNINSNDIFIDRNNTIYVIDSQNKRVYKWFDFNSTNAIFHQFNESTDTLFVSTTGDIYVSASGSSEHVQKWTAKTNTINISMHICGGCSSIFIDANDIFYCAIKMNHQIVTTSINNNSTILTVVAGTGFLGSESNMLHMPEGIFVDTNFDLYVADSGNNRIQLFHPGDLNGKTIAGTSDSILLHLPMRVLLDEDGVIYILHLIDPCLVRSGPKGYEPLVICEKFFFIFNYAMTFDIYGNIYSISMRPTTPIVKYLLIKNTCDSTNERIISRPARNISLNSTSTSRIQSVYNSKWAINSSFWYLEAEMARYYYDVIQLHVHIERDYDLFVNSTINVYAQLHRNYFDRIRWVKNSLLHHMGICYMNQFKYTTSLRIDERYFLIVAPKSSNGIDHPYSVTFIGPSNINFTHIVNSNFTQTNYTSDSNTNTHTCEYFGCKLADLYCDAVEINVTESGYYTLKSENGAKSFGFIYRNNLTEMNLRMKSIADGGTKEAKAFEYFVYHEVNISLILIVIRPRRLGEDTFSISVSGSRAVSIKHIDNIRSVIETIELIELDDNSKEHNHQNCYSNDYYYEALEINTPISTYYIFSSKSDIDTYAYLYKDYCDFSYPEQNLLDKNDDSCAENQFSMAVYLESNITYILIITTTPLFKNRKGQISLIIQGPSEVNTRRIHNLTSSIQSIYSSRLTITSSKYSQEQCDNADFYYEAIQVNVPISHNYTLASIGSLDILGFLYENYVNPYRPYERLHNKLRGGCDLAQFKINSYFKSDITYILLVTSYRPNITGRFSIVVSGPYNVSLNRINFQFIYSSELTKNSQVYQRDCGRGNYYYETVEINVKQSGSYHFDSNSSIQLYGYIYKNNFDPSYAGSSSSGNLITSSDFRCGSHQFGLGAYLQVSIPYILVITTREPKIQGAFTVVVNGPENLTLNRLVKKQSSCIIGDSCNLQTKSISLTINDILNKQILPNTSLYKQSLLVQVAATITMLMFVCGLVNGVLSLLTFQNKQIRQVGCSVYLFGSSIISLFTVVIFTIKFWLFVLTEIHVIVDSSIVRIDCAFINPILKLCLNLDAWLTVCVAIERAINILQGIRFNKTKSAYTARRIILILPILIMGTIVHEPIHHDLFEYTTEDQMERHIVCILRYSSSMQKYYMFILLFHLIVPFAVNLFSAGYIIFRSARQRSIAQTNRSYKQHILEQLQEHKQLLISPVILLGLALPRLIISLIPGCINPSDNPWLYLFGYFISYMPPMLIFIVFIVPSELYMKTLKEEITRWYRQICRSRQ